MTTVVPMTTTNNRSLAAAYQPMVLQDQHQSMIKRHRDVAMAQAFANSRDALLLSQQSSIGGGSTGYFLGGLQNSGADIGAN